MKTTVLLALTLLHLCNILSVSTGATTNGETFADPVLNDIQVKVYGSFLENLLRDVSKQITENAAFGERIDFESADLENSEGQIMIITEEEQEELAADKFSTVKDNSESVGSGLSCNWKGTHGQCCQPLKIVKKKHQLCLLLDISPPAQLKMALKFDSHNIFSQTFGIGNKNFEKCVGLGKLKICFTFYEMSITPHYIKICLRLNGKVGFIKFRKSLGCFDKKFVFDKIPTSKNRQNPFKDYSFNRPPRRYVHDNNVLRFEA